jgi:hypothetical protein
MVGVLTCREAYAYIGADGHPATVHEGDTVDEDNPIVKGHESKFEPFTVTHAMPQKRKG